jgi:ribosomal protein S1
LSKERLVVSEKSTRLEARARFHSQTNAMSDRRPSVPQEGSIQKGKVIRVEPAYCILQLLDFYPIRGLLHVSEMDL